MRLLLLVGAAVLVVACAGPQTTRPQPTTQAAPTTQPAATPPALELELADFKIEPDELTTAAGAAVINVTSAGPTPHNLTIRDSADVVVVGSNELGTGESDVLEANLAPGEYTMFCALPGHESLGMSATLTVTE